ncbi:MAG TPA: hypothetical protein VFU05_17285 [Cyclobacteriaceae bacterium]|nr:hypothetical protein [Cyclobacteriaceae bacterium]
MKEHEILNTGLAFALEFGTNWLQPIQSRLSEKYPDLKTKELNNYDKICRAAMKAGHEYVYKMLETAAREREKPDQQILADELQSFLHQKYPWVDENNIKSIFSQGCYYAYKDGLVL